MRSKLLSILLSLIMLLSCAALSSCQKPPEKFSEYSFDYFDTVTTIAGYAESQEAFDEIAQGVLAELEYIAQPFVSLESCRMPVVTIEP